MKVLVTIVATSIVDVEPIDVLGAEFKVELETPSFKHVVMAAVFSERPVGPRIRQLVDAMAAQAVGDALRAITKQEADALMTDTTMNNQSPGTA